MTLRRRLILGCLTLPGLLALPSAFAGIVIAPLGGVVTYGPVSAAAIPTLSEWGLIALGLLMTVMVYRILRGRLGGRPLASIVLAGVLGLGAVASGSRWLTTVYAIDAPPLTAAGGGTVNIPQDSFDHNLINTSGVPQVIRGIALQPGSFVNHGVAAPECTFGTVVAASASCHIRIDPAPPA